MNACNCCGAIVEDDADFEAAGGYCGECNTDRAAPKAGVPAAPVLATAADVCNVLQPLFDIEGVRSLNGPAGWRLAELIRPRDAADLTVREVRVLLVQIEAEQHAGGGK